jgi:hypothetical protein
MKVNVKDKAKALEAIRRPLPNWFLVLLPRGCS